MAWPASARPSRATSTCPERRCHPPGSLEQAVWTWVYEWSAWFDSNAEAGAGGEDCKRAVEADDGSGETDRQDLAAQGFLRLLQQLRIVLLQDSVVMRARREFPDHPMWADPIFARDDYLTFAKDVELALLDVEEPEKYRSGRRCRRLRNGPACCTKASRATSTN